MQNHYQSVELTKTQLWVLADSVQIGKLPASLAITPKAFITDAEKFHKNIALPLYEAQIIDDSFVIHPKIFEWLKMICGQEKYLTINYTYSDNKTLRLIITRAQDNKLGYVWIAGDRTRLGELKCDTIYDLINFLNKATTNSKPVSFETFYLSYSWIDNLLEKLKKNIEKIDITSLDSLFSQMGISEDAHNLNFISNAKIESSMTLLVTCVNQIDESVSTVSFNVLDTDKGRILTYPSTNNKGFNAVTYSSGTLENIIEQLQKTMANGSMDDWFTKQKKQ